LKTDLNVPTERKKPETFFVGILKATDEKSRIRILTRIPISIQIRNPVYEIQGSGSRSVFKYYGSRTLILTISKFDETIIL
jgi:hypothetical protein